jgi:hypothetical protein
VAVARGRCSADSRCDGRVRSGSGWRDRYRSPGRAAGRAPAKPPRVVRRDASPDCSRSRATACHRDTAGGWRVTATGQVYSRSTLPSTVPFHGRRRNATRRGRSTSAARSRRSPRLSKHHGAANQASVHSYSSLSRRSSIRLEVRRTFIPSGRTAMFLMDRPST